MPCQYAESHSYPSYAQAGEDRILYYFFECYRSARGLSYIDVGAAAPAGHNNSYLSYTLGGRGILVEPDPRFQPAYQLVRPEDLVDQSAVVPAELALRKSITFYSVENPGWSSVNIEQAQLAQKSGKGRIMASVTVPCLTLNLLLQRHFPDRNVDILSLDIPGLTFQVLCGLDFNRFRPTAIVIENPENSAVDSRIGRTCVEKLISARYQFLACTMVNSIFATVESITSMHS